MTQNNIEELYDQFKDTRDENIAISLYSLIYKDLFTSITNLKSYCSREIYSKRCSYFAIIEEQIIEQTNKRKKGPQIKKMTKEDVLKNNAEGLNIGYLISMFNLTEKYRKEYLDENYMPVPEHLKFKVEYHFGPESKELKAKLRYNFNWSLFTPFYEMLISSKVSKENANLKFSSIQFKNYLVIKFQDQYWEYVRKRLRVEFHYYNRDLLIQTRFISINNENNSFLDSETKLYTDAADKLIYSEIHEVIKETLNPKEYELLKLSLDKFTPEEIALMRGIKKNSLYTVTNRYKNKLRNVLKDYNAA